jgi:hypothetical protein
LWVTSLHLLLECNYCSLCPSVNTLRVLKLIFSFQTQIFCNLFEFPTNKISSKFNIFHTLARKIVK